MGNIVSKSRKDAQKATIADPSGAEKRLHDQSHAANDASELPVTPEKEGTTDKSAVKTHSKHGEDHAAAAESRWVVVEGNDKILVANFSSTAMDPQEFSELVESIHEAYRK